MISDDISENSDKINLVADNITSNSEKIHGIANNITIFKVLNSKYAFIFSAS